MSKVLFCVLFAAALLLGMALRFGRPDLRPLHHDEANQAVRFGTLLETGEYRYEPRDHHGPTLYYLTLPSAWIRNQKTVAALDERTLRIVPAVFGVGVILLFLAFVRDLGRSAVMISALLAAVSPALTYYSRFYIQESLFLFFALGFVIALGRYALRPTAGWALAAGALAGLAYSTKETSVIVLVTALAACVIARLTTSRNPLRATWRHLALALGVSAGVAITFYSSFFRHPSAFTESLAALPIYVARGLDAGAHSEPWDYYLRILAWSSSGGLVWTESLVLVLALSGAAFALRRGRTAFWPLYLCVYSLTTAVIFSVIRYKTPWNLLSFHVGFVLLAGYGAAALVQRARSLQVRALVVIVLLVASAHLALQDWRANFSYPADPRNPYAYAQTSADFLRLVRRISDLAALHADGRNMLVKVIAGPYEQWPLPWYVRGMTHVGYWASAREAGALDGTPVIVASQENAGAIERALGGGYVAEFYGLRPGVLLTVYVQRPLWERFLQSARSDR